MKITVLIDNIPMGDLESEWGLSFYIEEAAENGGHKILLDTGASEKYLANAEKLGVDVAEAEYAFLSHSHWDHDGGFLSFFEKNKKAVLYLQDSCTEDCYVREEGELKKGGLPEGLRTNFADRLHFVSGVTEVYPGLTIVPHKEPEKLSWLGVKNGLFRLVNGEILPDDFAHEQTLVFETEKGLILFNSCSHGGVDVILDEVSEVFPGKKILAYLGGLHLYLWSDEEVRALGEKMEGLGIEKIYTGHCTGEKAFAILKERLGDRMIQLHSGLAAEL